MSPAEPPATVEPVPGEPAAVTPVDDGRALLIADYHAGYEAALSAERGVGVPSRARQRRDRLLGLLERTAADRLVVLGDLMHSIGGPGGAERGELEVLFESLPRGLGVTVVKGNHDGAIGDWLPEAAGTRELRIVPGRGTRVGDLGVCHGHTWPSASVLGAPVVCHGHDHPSVRLTDEVGGSRTEPVWLRGRLDPAPFRARGHDLPAGFDERPPRLVVFPAFNELTGGTWLNVGGSFLAPFLPDGAVDVEAYLLDGTRLGPYRTI